MAVSVAEGEPETSGGDAHPGASSNVWVILAVIVAASIFLRVGIAIAVPVHRLIDPDTPGYLHPAWALVDDGAFHVSPQNPLPEFFRTPGYPAFLALISQAVGRSIRNLAITQAALSAFTALGVYLLTRRWFDSAAVALGAAVLAAFEPLQLWASSQVLTESLTAVLYLLLALAATSAARTRSPVRWVLTGVLLATATYVRPATYYLPLLLAPVVLIGLASSVPQGWAWRRAVAGTAALIVPFVLLIGLWQVRNYEQVGSWRFTSVEAFNMYDYRAPEVLAYESGDSYRHTRNLLDYFFIPAHQGLPQGEYWDDMYHQGLTIVQDHPKAFAVTAGIGVFVIAFGTKPNVLNTLGIDQSVGLTVLAEVGLLAFYALAVIGVVRVFREHQWDQLRPAHLVVLTLVVYTIVTAGIAVGPRGTARLRAPVMPLLCPYVALGTATLIRRYRPTTQRQDDPAALPDS